MDHAHLESEIDNYVQSQSKNVGETELLSLGFSYYL